MDLMMPVMDGLEATRRIRLLPVPLAGVPIIITASTSRADESTSYAAGANAFIAKPIDHEVLLRTLEAQLALHWIYAAGALEPGTAEQEEIDHPVPPPPDEMAALHQLALAGNIRKIRARAAYLKQLDPRYAWLAKRLLSLAETYQSKAIVALVERYLET